MKKIFTLALMAFFFYLNSMAQVVLGDINFSLKEGMKINPSTGKITVTFSNVTGVDDPASTDFVLTGNDVILIYASSETPDGIVEVKSANQNAAPRKMMKDGKVIIQTEAGFFNAIGVKMQ